MQFAPAGSIGSGSTIAFDQVNHTLCGPKLIEHMVFKQTLDQSITVRANGLCLRFWHRFVAVMRSSCRIPCQVELPDWETICHRNRSTALDKPPSLVQGAQSPASVLRWPAPCLRKITLSARLSRCVSAVAAAD